VTSHIEPLAAEARPVRSSGHRVKHDSRMLGRPQRPAGAVNVLILAAQLFALIPRPPGNAHPGRRDLPRNPRRHLLGRKQQRNTGPTCLPPITVLAGRESFRAVGRECRSLLILVWPPQGGALARTGWCWPLRHPSHPRAWGWRAVQSELGDGRSSLWLSCGLPRCGRSRSWRGGTTQC
jgi:hypothetical protein